MNRYLVDFSILLHDFFHRYPEYGSMRYLEPVSEPKLLAYRSAVHNSLVHLAGEQGVMVVTCQHFLLRLCSIMAEYHVPNTIMLQEVSYLMNNYELKSINEWGIYDVLQELTKAENKDAEADLDFLILQKMALKEDITIFLTADPRFLEMSSVNFRVISPTMLERSLEKS